MNGAHAVQSRPGLISRRQPGRAHQAWQVLGPLVAGGAAVVIGLGVNTSSVRLVLAAVLAVTLASLVAFDPRKGMIVVVIVGFYLGVGRRMMSALLGVTPKTDVMLLVVPISIGVLFVVAVSRGALRDRSRLATIVLALNALALIGAANPLQGSAKVGVEGLEFTLIPLLLFWAARSMASRRGIETLLKAAFVSSVVAAGYGIYQVFVGFPVWDKQWLSSAAASFASLSVGAKGQYRPFSLFMSQQDYGRFLAIGLTLCAALVVGRRWRLAGILFFPVLAIGLILASSRVSIIVAATGIALIFSARRKWPLLRALIAGVLFLGLVYLVAGKVASSTGSARTQSSTANALVAHTAGGLANPLSSSQSTLNKHATATVDNIKAAFSSRPLGDGSGAATPAAKSATSHSESADADPGNLAADWGAPGLVLWGLLVIVGISTAYTYAVRRQDWVAFAILGLAVATVLEWVNGDLYASVPLLWVALGFLDAQTVADPPATGGEPVAQVVAAPTPAAPVLTGARP